MCGTVRGDEFSVTNEVVIEEQYDLTARCVNPPVQRRSFAPIFLLNNNKFTPWSERFQHFTRSVEGTIDNDHYFVLVTWHILVK
jgi:hypothetical protein